MVMKKRKMMNLKLRITDRKKMKILRKKEKQTQIQTFLTKWK